MTALEEIKKAEHERIWLEPAGAPDRCWCQDNQWGDEGVEYVLASTLESLQRENEELTSGIKRLSDEEELLAETTGDMVSVVKLAAKLALSETHVNELQKANVAYVDANTALIRENEALKKDRDFWKEQFQVETRYRIELADRGTLLALTDANSRAEAAEAEVKRLRDLLRFSHDTLWEINPSNYDHDDVCKLNDASVEVILAIAPELGETHGKSKEWWDERQALASTGGEHHAE